MCIRTNHHNHAKLEFHEIKIKLSVSPPQHSYDSQMKITGSETDMNGQRSTVTTTMPNFSDLPEIKQRTARTAQSQLSSKPSNVFKPDGVRP